MDNRHYIVSATYHIGSSYYSELYFVPSAVDAEDANRQVSKNMCVSALTDIEFSALPLAQSPLPGSVEYLLHVSHPVSF